MSFQERINFAFRRENERRVTAGQSRLTKRDLWSASGMSSGAISQWFSGAVRARLEKCISIAPLLGVNPFWLFDGSKGIDDPWGFTHPNAQAPIDIAAPSNSSLMERVAIQQYDPTDVAGAMGHGLELRDQPGVIQSWSVNKEWLQQNVRAFSSHSNLRIVTGFGDSMQPMFNSGDPLLVDIGVERVEFDAVYFFRIANEGYIKRLQRIPTEKGLVIRAISENRAVYEPFDITGGMDFQVLARVLKVWRSQDL